MNAIVTNRPWVLALAAGLALATPGWRAWSAEATPPAAAAAAEAGDAMPVRAITLYRSGVGAFQREGTVADRARVQLRFDVGQINDILKSLQILDLGGGSVESVSYASKDPLARRLGAFSVPIADSPSLPELLNRLRGSGVRVTTPEGAVEGVILGVELRQMAGSTGDRPAPINVHFLNLVTPAGVRSMAIPSLTGLQLTDAKLADELQRALTAVAEARAERIKTVDLALAGAGERRVVVRYVHETPVWKTSYRLVIPEAEAAKEGPGDALALQGWAIVENTTDTDWRDVRLTLVSGRPVSFQMDLSEPLYLPRPEVPVPTMPGVMPREYAGGVSVSAPPAPSAAPSMGRPGARGSEGGPEGLKRSMRDRAGLADMVPGSPGGPAEAQAANLSADDLARYSPAAQATAGEAGEVFFFEAKNPVTIERQRSALIPFISTGVQGRRVSIFSAGDGSPHPMRGVEVVNTSDLQLLPGPLAVFDGSAYAGDAQIGHVSPGDKRLLAYAVDLDVQVLRADTSTNDLVKLRIVSGVFELTQKDRVGTTYTFANKDAKRPRTIVLEHPRLDGWELVAPAKAAEATQDLYRFDVSAGAGQTVKMEVLQERVQQTQVGLDAFDAATIVRFSAQGKVSPAIVEAIRRLGQLRTDVVRAEETLGQQEARISANTGEQNRLGDMLRKVPDGSNLYADYLKELGELNTGLKALRADRERLIERRDAARAALDTFVSNLNVE